MSPESARPPAPAPRESRAPNPVFSLFEGDWMQSTWAQLGLGSHRRFYVLWRCLAAFGITYLPMAVLAWRQGLYSASVSPTNFFADFAAYACFMLGLPLFIVAEIVIDGSTRGAATDFLRCGVVRSEDIERVEREHERIRRWRTSRRPDVVCVVIAYMLSLAILVPQFGPDPLPTWHVTGDVGARALTAAGCWAFFIALPLLNYVWLRLGFKTLVWIRYLYVVSRARLDLHPTHPDLTGGIGFVSEAQGHFALFILAYGISNVAAPVGYQIAVQNYDLTIMPVWAPLVGFIVGAPLLFTLPLFMFTKQLFRAKRRALAAFRERAAAHVRRIEVQWLHRTDGEAGPDQLRELAEQGNLDTVYARIHRMRVVPFDLKSFGQLVGSTLGAVATLLPLLHQRGELKDIVEVVGKLFEQMGAH